MDRSRLEAFSDGVFAVAITLLALNLTVAGPGHGKLIDQLGAHWPSFVAYLISFFTIGIIWVNHHSLIRSVKLVDRTLLFVNLVLLLFVVLIPFATGLVAEYLRTSHNPEDPRVAMALFAGVFLGMSAGFGLIFEWTLHGDRVYQPVPRDKRWAARFRFVGGASVYVVALLVALVWAYVAFALMGLVAVYYIFDSTPTSSAAPAEPGEPSAADSPDGGAPRT
ncbi:MAG TPA: TMEM175 family protein [Streptosporangiaceae bacterium]